MRGDLNLDSTQSEEIESIEIRGAAVMTRAFPDYMAQRKDLMLLQNIASYLLLACGVIYFILGVLCIGFLKRARQQKEISREQAVKDLEEIARRREELFASEYSSNGF